MFTCPQRRQAAPFRVSIHDRPQAFILRLEGRLAADGAPEVEARWRTAASMIGSRKLVLALSSAFSVDPAGRRLLDRMYLNGAQFVAENPETRSLVSEITGAPAPAASLETDFRQTFHLFRDFPTLIACLFMRLKTLAE